MLLVLFLCCKRLRHFCISQAILCFARSGTRCKGFPFVACYSGRVRLEIRKDGFQHFLLLQLVSCSWIALKAFDSYSFTNSRICRWHYKLDLTITIGRTHNHPMRWETHKLPCLQVRQDQDPLTLQVFNTVVLAKSRCNLPRDFFSNINLFTEEFVGFFMFPCFLDDTDSNIQLGNVNWWRRWWGLFLFLLFLLLCLTAGFLSRHA
mmetsp:Transcript_42304/g.62761  ORF Transcript_42304/g.62761 Transcript_42304/m.62761 type:complete len:206 (+) Transcript_42304:29-646(+)